MHRTSISCVLLLAVFCTAQPVHAAPSCSALSKDLKLPHTTITLAAEVPAGTFKPPGGGGVPGGLAT